MSQSLYSVVDKDTLHNIVEAFYGCIKLPIQVIDEDGNFLESFGDTGKFCSFFQKHLPPEDTCQKMHVGASKRAISLGEPYIFSCHAHLNHIVYPLIVRINSWVPSCSALSLWTSRTPRSFPIFPRNIISILTTHSGCLKNPDPLRLSLRKWSTTSINCCFFSSAT